MNSDGSLVETKMLSIGDYQYERNFIDVNNMEDGYIRIPLSFDITMYAMFYQRNNIAVYFNEENTTGCFFVPFIEYHDKGNLSLDISKFVQRVGFEMHTKFGISNPYIKVYVYRFVDPNGKRFFAIGGTNLSPKSEKIHNLNVKTLLTDTIKPSPTSSWSAVVQEMGDAKNLSVTCKISKDEVMDFERKRVVVKSRRNTKRHLLVMLPKTSQFFAEHISEDSNGTQFDHAANRHYGIYGLYQDRFPSMTEVNVITKKMIESFREITGSSFVEASIVYNVLPGDILDASIVCFEGEDSLLYPLPEAEDCDF
jgi:hypothetical protein